MKDCLLTFNYQSMTGIMTTLKTGNGLCLVSQQINDLTFAFITPLSTNDYYVLTHKNVSVS